jgi:hypothetical protein
MEVTERSCWAVAELVDNKLRLIDKDLSEDEALKLASQYNKVGDYSYVAVPIIITHRRGKLAEFDTLYKRLQQGMG